MTFVPPSEGVIPVDNVQQLLQNVLVDAGVVGIDEAIEQPYLNRALTQANWLLAQWARKRWLCYRIQDYSVVCTGAQTYTVGKGQQIDINPRPDRLEYAFLRFLPAVNSNPSSGSGGSSDFNSDFNSDFGPLGNGNATGGLGGSLPVDFQLDIIPSHQDYARITVKTVGTLAWRIFYDPIWPIGLLFPWPIPQASIYELHVGFKVVLPRFQSLQQSINFPPEYEAALNWSLARRLRASYQMPPDPEVNALARDALNSMRLANQAMPTLRLPEELTGRNRAYDYRSDGN